MRKKFSCILLILILSLATYEFVYSNNWESIYQNYIYTLEKNNGILNPRIGLYDIDKNSIPELFVEHPEKMYEIYTIRNCTMIKIGDIFLKPYITERDCSVFTYGGSGTGVYSGLLYTWDNDILNVKWLLRAYFSDDEKNFYLNKEGELNKMNSVSKEEYNVLLKEYKKKEIRLYRTNEIIRSDSKLKAFVTSANVGYGEPIGDEPKKVGP